MEKSFGENITIAIMTVAVYYPAAFVKTLNSQALTDNYVLALHCRMCYKIQIHGLSFKFQKGDNSITTPVGLTILNQRSFWPQEILVLCSYSWKSDSYLSPSVHILLNIHTINRVVLRGYYKLTYEADITLVPHLQISSYCSQ